MSDIRIATIGSSAITERFIDALAKVDGVSYVAAYSRDLTRARAFGEPRGATCFFDSLGELVSSDAVDAVYVASPNGLHAAQALRCVKAGKHVLVEKAFAANERLARELFDAAHASGVVALEAMRNLHTEGFAAIERNLGRLGALRQATLRFGKVTSRIKRLNAGEYVSQFDPALASGALVDIGVYVVEPAIALFGRPDRVRASLVTIPVPWGGGGPYVTVDLAGCIVLEYADKVVELSYSKVGDDLLASQAMGDTGTLIWDATNCPRKVTFITHEDVGMAYATVGGTKEEIAVSVPENDMVCEIELFRDAVGRVAGALERVGRFEQATIDSLAVMDEARAQAGVRYPHDEEGSAAGVLAPM